MAYKWEDPAYNWGPSSLVNAPWWDEWKSIRSQHRPWFGKDRWAARQGVREAYEKSLEAPPILEGDASGTAVTTAPATTPVTDPVTGVVTQEPNITAGLPTEVTVGGRTIDYSPIERLFQQLLTTEYPTPDPLVGSEPWNALTEMLDLIGAGATSEDVTTATAQAAEMAGLEPGVYQQLAGDVAAGRGLTDVQRAEFERSTLRSTREAERFAQNQLNTMRAGSGSSYKQWAAVESGIDKINDVRSAGRLAQLNAELERTAQKMTQIQGIAGSAQEQLALMQRGWAQAAQAYAGQVMVIYQQNVQERDAISDSIQATMTAMDAEMGLIVSANADVENLVEQYYQVSNIMLEREALRLEQQATRDEAALGLLAVTADLLGIYDAYKTNTQEA